MKTEAELVMERKGGDELTTCHINIPMSVQPTVKKGSDNLKKLKW